MAAKLPLHVVLLGFVVAAAAGWYPQAERPPSDQESALYWRLGFPDATEFDIHGTSLTEPVEKGRYVDEAPPAGAGRIYVLIEGSTGWFMDDPAKKQAAAVGGAVAASVTEAAADEAGKKDDEPEVKVRKLDEVMLYGLNDNSEVVKHWVFKAATLTGRSVDDNYVVCIDYEGLVVSH